MRSYVFHVTHVTQHSFLKYLFVSREVFDVHNSTIYTIVARLI